MLKSSYLVKLLAFVLGLVVTLEAISYVATRIVINKAVTQNARAELLAGGELFQRIVEQNVKQLALSVKVLTEDFGFKDAVATKDENTIRSALNNHSARVNADVGVLITLDGKLIASDASFGLKVTNELQQLRDKAEAQGQAYDTVIVDNKAYQFVFFAVKAPIVIGLAGMGFEVKREFSNDLKRLTGLEVSIVNFHADNINYLSGTLDDDERQRLVAELRQDYAEGSVFEYAELMSLQVPFARQNKALIAVLQVPLSKVLAPFASLNVQLLILALSFSALAAVAAWFLARSVTRPVRKLAGIARRIAKGFYDTPIKVQSNDELGELASAFINMQEAIGEREQQVRYQSEHDPLTGLPNRIRIVPELEAAIAQAQQQNNKIYLFVMDIKNFTQINDELSQEIGDGVLRAAGQKLLQTMGERKVYRLGSDEFLGVLNNYTSEAAGEFIESIHCAYKNPMIVSGIQVNIEVNIGLAAFPDDASSVESLLRRVNLALNNGRIAGKNTCFYQNGWDENHLRRLHLSREFETSLAKNHISLHYQPKINLENPHVLGAEALVRWHHPEMGFIGPDEFIGILESSGQITLLTRWVLKVAILKIKQLILEGINLKLSVNLSALDLLVEDLPEYVGALLDVHQVPADYLCLEITESAIMREAEKSINNLKRLEALGLTLSIDDFGTGYSSLSQLKKLPVSELKIDKSFIMNLDSSADDQLIVRSTIELGHTMGLSVTAEGVETEAIKHLLKSYGCDVAQGYLYSKPLPSEAFSNWMKQYLAGLTS